MAKFTSEDIVLFTSNNHVRYNGGIRSDKNNFGARRGILIIPRGHGTYEVSIHVLNENYDNWGECVQMAPKQMRIEELAEYDNVVSMRGFGYDMFGTPFSDYGIKIHLGLNDVIEKIALYMYDRDVVIEYLAN